MKALMTGLLFILFTATAAYAQEAPVRMIVSVGEMGPDRSTEWRGELCKNIHAWANETIAQGAQITCRSFDAFHMIDTYIQQLKSDNLYHIRILRGFKGALRVSVTNWNRNSDSDFNSVGWSIAREPHTLPRRSEALKNVLGNFFNYVQYEKDLKAVWLLNARTLSNVITYDFKDLTFKSLKDRKKISLQQAVHLFEKESPENAAYLRARSEMAVAYSTEGADLGIFSRETSLESILDKSAVAARTLADTWSELIAVDAKGLSDVTIQVMAAAPAPEKTTSSIFAPTRKTAPKRKAPGKLILLF